MQDPISSNSIPSGAGDPQPSGTPDASQQLPQLVMQLEALVAQIKQLAAPAADPEAKAAGMSDADLTAQIGAAGLQTGAPRA